MTLTPFRMNTYGNKGRGTQLLNSFLTCNLQRSLKRGAAKALSVLRGNFVGDDPAQRSCARNRNCMCQKFVSGEMNSTPMYCLPSRARWMETTRLSIGLRRVIIHQDQRLPHQDDLFKLKQGPVPVHRLRMRLGRELFT